MPLMPLRRRPPSSPVKLLENRETSDISAEILFFFFFVAHRGEVRIEDCPESERGHHPAWLAKRNDDDDDDDDDDEVKDEDWGSRSPGRLRRTRVPPPKGRRRSRCFRRK